MALTLRGSGQVSADNYGIDSDGSITATGITSSGNLLLETSGNPSITNKTTGAGNNPSYRLQADTNYWDLQGTFSNANDELFFMHNGSIKMGIDASGRITTPNQPSFIARTNSTFNYTGGTGYQTITCFGNAILNRSNSYNTSNGTFTAPVTGHYQFNLQLLLSNVATGDDSIHIAFTQSGAQQIYANIRSPGSAANGVVGYGQYLPVIGVGDMYMSANDTLQIKLSSSGTMNIYGGADWGRFSGHLIG